ncbi:hypothetical protein LXL04_029244 [Taraxacum kok-saghyz]
MDKEEWDMICECGKREKKLSESCNREEEREKDIMVIKSGQQWEGCLSLLDFREKTAFSSQFSPPSFSVKLPETSSADPSSPKLSCIGQIKKISTTTTSSNRFLACKLSASTNAKSAVHSSFSYSKLHRLFSGRNRIARRDFTKLVVMIRF